MPLYQKKPVIVEAITFEALVEYGLRGQTHIVNGVPWSFLYKGHHITHENEHCYVIPTLEGNMLFNRGDMLITGVYGEIYPCKMEIFNKTYKRVPCERLFEDCLTLGFKDEDACGNCR